MSSIRLRRLSLENCLQHLASISPTAALATTLGMAASALPFLDVSIETIAGQLNSCAGHVDGDALQSASFTYPRQLSMLDKNTLLIADSGSHKVRQLNLLTGVVSTLAGTGKEQFADGAAKASQFRWPMGVCVDPWRRILVADQKNACIRQLLEERVDTVAGSAGHEGHADGAATGEAQFGAPGHLAADAFGHVFIADSTNHCVRMMTPLGPTRESERIAALRTPTRTPPSTTTTGVSSNAVTSSDIDWAHAHAGADSTTVSATAKPPHVIEVSTVVGASSLCRGKMLPGSHTEGKLHTPCGVAIDYRDRLVIVNESGHTVVRVDPHDNKSIELLAGQYRQRGHCDDWDNRALFDTPSGVAIDDFHNIFVADRSNHCVRVILPHGASNYISACLVKTTIGEVMTLIGSPERKGNVDGNPEVAALHFPVGICYDIFSAHAGRPRLFVADSHRICAVYYRCNALYKKPERPRTPTACDALLAAVPEDSTVLTAHFQPPASAIQHSTAFGACPEDTEEEQKPSSVPSLKSIDWGLARSVSLRTESDSSSCQSAPSSPAPVAPSLRQSLSGNSISSSSKLPPAAPSLGTRTNSGSNLSRLDKKRDSQIHYASNKNVMSEEQKQALAAATSMSTSRLSSIEPSPASSSHATPAGSPRASEHSGADAGTSTTGHTSSLGLQFAAFPAAVEAFASRPSSSSLYNDRDDSHHNTPQVSFSSAEHLHTTRLSIEARCISPHDVIVAQAVEAPRRQPTFNGTVFDQLDKNAERENAEQWTRVADEKLHPKLSSISAKSGSGGGGNKPTSCCTLM